MATSSNPSEIFKSDQHSTNISKKLLRFYETSQLFDITLLAKNDSVKIPAHIFVLSTLSEYFLDKFHEKYTAYYEPKDIDATALKMIVDFMYSGQIELNLENAESILRTAEFLKIKILVEGCCNFIEKHMDTKNCLKYFSLSKELCLSAFKDKCLKYICTHFEQILKQKELLLLNEIELKYLLKNINPDGDSDLEQCIFLAIVAWIEYDNDNRKHLTDKFLLMVRHQFLTLEFILKNWSPAGKTKESSELVYSWLRMLSEAQPTNQRKSVLEPKNVDRKTRKRNCSNSQKVVTQHVCPSRFYFSSSKVDDKCPDTIFSNFQKDMLETPPTFMFGPDCDQENRVSKLREENGKLAVISCSKNRGIVIQTYNHETDSWSIEKQIPLHRKKDEFSLIVIDEKLIIVGGTIDDEITNSVECLNLHTFEWSDLPPMQKRRYYSVLGNLNGDLYVFGGGSHPGTMEKYIFSERQWTMCQKEPNGLRNQFAQNGVLYRVSLAKGYIKYWDVFSNKFTAKTIKTKKLTYFGVAVIGDFLYIIGGIMKGSLTRSVKRYDLLKDTWCEVSPLPLARASIKAMVFKNKIVVFGGSPGPKLVHEYNPDTDSWKSLHPLLSSMHYWSSAFCTLPIKE